VAVRVQSGRYRSAQGVIEIAQKRYTRTKWAKAGALPAPDQLTLPLTREEVGVDLHRNRIAR
jgi:hypothetical protein